MHTGALNFRVFLLIALLPVFDGASAQTVEWWDPVAEAENRFFGLPLSGNQRCGCDALGNYSVGLTQCVNDSGGFQRTQMQGPAREARRRGRSALAKASAGS